MKKILLIVFIYGLIVTAGYAQHPSPKFQLYPRAKHRFLGKKIGIELEFLLKDGNIMGVKASKQGQTFQFKKR
ncbi:MAG: hypothetical protein ACPGJS_19715 [Flammeovirgaceae bacterium]